MRFIVVLQSESAAVSVVALHTRAVYVGKASAECPATPREHARSRLAAPQIQLPALHMLPATRPLLPTDLALRRARRSAPRPAVSAMKRNEGRAQDELVVEPLGAHRGTEPRGQRGGLERVRGLTGRSVPDGYCSALLWMSKVCFQLYCIRPGLPKGGHYSTRTVNATSEDSQQGWCGVCLCGLGKGWLCGGVSMGIYLR